MSVSYQRSIAAEVPLPATALLEQDGKDFVWIVDPKALTVAQRPVTVGGKTADTVEVTGGVNEGDRVVVAGVHSLKDGQAVKLDGEGS